MDIELELAHKDHEARKNKILGKIELALPREGGDIVQIIDEQLVRLLKEIKEFLEEGDI